MMKRFSALLLFFCLLLPAALAEETLAPVNTPTPMPVSGADQSILDLLTSGLWKKLGTDGSTYYQFTADGKLLTISVSPYALADGRIESDVFTGEIDPGGAAWTLETSDGARTGYVLNRRGDAVAPEEFVTPSPTPPPTPTPTPSPTPSPTPVPTPTPTPVPTPTPTPTLSPYEVAVRDAPTLVPQEGVSFLKRQDRKVYTAPGDDAYSVSSAKVMTDANVDVYGTLGDWVLVGYPINNRRGRIGYITDTAFGDDATPAELKLASIPITLKRNANGTDDPLNAKTRLCQLAKGAEVTLLAFLGEEWAYVETALKGETCRVFIPRTALSGS